MAPKLLAHLLQGAGLIRKAKAEKSFAPDVIDYTGKTVQGIATDALYLEMSEPQRRAFVIGAGDTIECLAKYLEPRASEGFAHILTYLRQLDTDSRIVKFDEYVRTHRESERSSAASSFLSMLIEATGI